MDFTKKPEVKNSTAPLTPELGQQIYELIKSCGNADLAYKNQDGSKYDWSNIEKVDKEGDRIMNEIMQKMSGNYLLAEAVTHVDETTGEMVVDSPAKYYKPTTEKDLIGSISSEILSVEALLSDMMGESDWDEFVKSFNTESDGI